MKLFRDKQILIIGDVMLDSYFFGNVERISPEAPVPVVDILNKKNKLGGSANVATNIKNLGGTPILCSVIGNDSNGEILLSLLKSSNISTKYIFQSKNRITTNKIRIIGNNHQMLRVDEEVKTNLGAEQEFFINTINTIFDEERIECVLFQDYDKGIINEEIIDIVTKKSKKLNIPILVDPKKRNFTNYNNITLFKPNYKEFKESISINNGISKEEYLVAGSKILHDKNIDIVFVTLSENGIFLSYKENEDIIYKMVPGIVRDVVDVSGAGDTVISVISMLINDIHIEEIAKIANIAGGIVCEEVGVVPIDKMKLLKEYESNT